MGPQLAVVVNDYETAKDAFLKHGDMLSGRPQWYLFKKISTGPDIPEVSRGVVNSEGKLWKEQRKFALSKLREFGMGKVSLENKIKEEIAVLLSEFNSRDGIPFDIQYLINTSVSNIICSIMFGERFSYEDKKLQHLLRNLHEIFNVPLQGIVQFFPIVRFLPSERVKIRQLVDATNALYKFIEEKIEECDKTLDCGNIRNFIDAYLVMIQEQIQTREYSSFSKAELSFVIRDLFAPGTETTSTTLRWGFLYMLKHPHIMKRVQAEIDDVIGRSRLPKMTDKLDMPYTEATILEIQRCANILPLGVPHRSLERMNFRGFEIPSNTLIIPNMTAILNDPAYFKNSQEFNPGRFMTSEGKLGGHETVTPFSVGRRVCLGEALAKMELFLFFTSILQNFNIALPDGTTEPNMKGFLGATYQPNNDPLQFLPR